MGEITSKYELVDRVLAELDPESLRPPGDLDDPARLEAARSAAVAAADMLISAVQSYLTNRPISKIGVCCEDQVEWGGGAKVG